MAPFWKQFHRFSSIICPEILAPSIWNTVGVIGFFAVDGVASPHHKRRAEFLRGGKYHLRRISLRIGGLGRTVVSRHHNRELRGIRWSRQVASSRQRGERGHLTVGSNSARANQHNQEQLLSKNWKLFVPPKSSLDFYFFAFRLLAGTGFSKNTGARQSSPGPTCADEQALPLLTRRSQKSMLCTSTHGNIFSI